MKLKVSFCNKTVLRNDLTRFAPVWGSYTLFLAAIVLAYLNERTANLDNYYTEIVKLFSARAGHMTLINGFYALLVVQALWGDLLTPRMCNSLHAMPVTRDSYFGAHLTAALLFALVPNLLVYGAAALMVKPLVASAPLMALGAGCLQYIFYLGAALVAVQLAGNRMGLVLTYGLINFITILLYWFCSQVFAPLTYGLELDVSWVAKLCPTVAMYRGSYFKPVNYWESYDYPWHYQGMELGELFPPTFAYAGLGLVFIAAAQLLYRKRDLEVAGDTLAYPILKPVFLTLYTMMVAAFVHLGAKTFSVGGISQYWFLPLGLLVGYVSGLMLLMRTSRVFRKQLLVPLAGILAMCALAVWAIYTDPFGAIRYVPAKKDIASVSVMPLVSYNRYYPDSDKEADTGLLLTDPEDIDTVLCYHAAALFDWQAEIADSLKQAPGCWTPGASVNIRLEYHLQNGRTVARRYALRLDNSAMDRFRMILSRPELSFGMTEELLRKRIDEAEQIVYYPYQSDEAHQQLWFPDHEGLTEAILADCRAGNILSFPYVYDEEIASTSQHLGSLDISGHDDGEIGKSYYTWVGITPRTVHILHWLDTHEGDPNIPRS